MSKQDVALEHFTEAFSTFLGTKTNSNGKTNFYVKWDESIDHESQLRVN